MSARVHSNAQTLVLGILAYVYNHRNALHDASEPLNINDLTREILLTFTCANHAYAVLIHCEFEDLLQCVKLMGREC